MSGQRMDHIDGTIPIVLGTTPPKGREAIVFDDLNPFFHIGHTDENLGNVEKAKKRQCAQPDLTHLPICELCKEASEAL
jgi:hypothetical protein